MISLYSPALAGTPGVRLFRVVDPWAVWRDGAIKLCLHMRAPDDDDGGDGGRSDD